jgi:hypothetical protein
MAVQHQIPDEERRGRLRPVIAGGIAAIALFVLNVTLGVLAILVLGGLAGGMALFREHGTKRLSRFFIGMLLGMVLFLVLAWYGTATTPPALQSG